MSSGRELKSFPNFREEVPRKSLLTDANTQARTHTGTHACRHAKYRGYSSAGFLLINNVQDHIQAVSVAKHDIVYNSWLAYWGFTPL